MATFIVRARRFLKQMVSYADRIREKGRSVNPFFCLMGIDVAQLDKGFAVLKMEVRPDMMNGAGWLQGGIFTALADEAFALALSSEIGPQDGIATISESTTFIKGVRTGVLLAEGRVIKKGRRVAFTEGYVRADDPEKTLLSKTSAAFAITSSRTAG